MQGTYAGANTVPPERITDHAARALRSPRTLAEAAVDLAAKVRGLVSDDAAIQIARPDAAGRLRIVWRDGLTSTDFLDRSRHRRNAHAEHRASLISTREGRAVAFVPLQAAGAALGTLEIDAAESRLREAWDAIELLGGHLAATINATSEFDRLRNEVRALEAASLLGRRLARASSTAAGVEMAVRFMGSRFRVPVAGWTRDPDGTLNLVATSRVGLSARASLTTATVATDELDGDEDRARTLREAFVVSVRARAAMLVDAGPAVLVVTQRTTDGSAIDEVGALFGEMLRLAADHAAAAARRRQLDMGLAWTAHELKGPLLGVRAALEAMDHRVDDPRDRAMMQSSVRELDQLMGTTEALLTWAAGTRSLDRAPEDLVGIVREAIASSRRETGVEAVVTAAPQTAIVPIDRTHVRTAVANLLRNAAAHADADTTVEVSVEQVGNRLVLRVTDHGPSIAEEDRAAIFDPFVRGASASRGTGHGLGLFITRRVVEAHGGSVWVESGGRRTTFSIALPADAADERGERRFAS